MINEKKLPEKLSDKLHENLQELIGYHRQLFEVMKSENEALVSADIKRTYEASSAKEALVHWIYQTELNRQTINRALAIEENLETETPTLRELAIHFHSKDPEAAQKLAGDLNMLTVLVERIKKQNESNGSLIALSLKHIESMKKNIFGETSHQANTYNQHGQKNSASANEHGPRLISREV